MPRKLPIYPFLIAIWPPLALAAKNAHMLDHWSQVVAPAGLGIIAAGMGWAMAAALRLTPTARTSAAALSAIWFWSFRWVVNTTHPSTLLALVGLDQAGRTLALLSLLVLVTLVSPRMGSTSPRVSRTLTAASLMLVIFSFSMVVTRTGRFVGPVGNPGDQVLPKRPSAHPHDPEVFVIVLDTYTGVTSLQRNYGFDNSDFMAALEARGFVLPPTFGANYPQTALALSAVLHWDYLDAYAPDLPTDAADWRALVATVHTNPTWRLFRSRGYYSAYLPYSRTITGRHPFADLRDDPQSTDFQMAWRIMTPLPELMGWIRKVRGRQASPTSRMERLATQTDRQFVRLETLPTGNRPVFAFAHFLPPHDPMVYNADCSYRSEPIWPAMDRTIPVAAARVAYVDQVQCINRKILSLVDKLIARRTEPPVIVLLSDHGRGEPPYDLPPLESADAELVTERMDAFAAALVPDTLRAAVATAGSPVNLFRAILREVFGLPLPPLEDRAFWAPSGRPFALSPLDWNSLINARKATVMNVSNLASPARLP
jgi:hypothetical protein